jgi:hypothetical protein
VFDAIARAIHPHVELMRNERNLGFTGTANRGMGLSRRDVVLLNSDTIVTDGWLEALLRCAASDPSIGTITPWSNNAEILSYPRFCVNNAWPAGADPAPLARAFARAAVPSYPDLPTGVGFCFFVRRAMLDAIGGFDAAFGAGYGEENDLHARRRGRVAQRAGRRRAGAAHGRALVREAEGRAGAEEHRDAARAPSGLPVARARLRRRGPARACCATRRRWRSTPRIGRVLHVLHHQGGGTETHVRALVAATRGRCRHAIAVAVGDRWRIEAHRPDGGTVVFDLERLPDEPWGDFLGGLCATLGIGLVHVHNVSACRDGLLTALAAIDLPFGYTVHDVNAGCPTITFLGPDGLYCGAQTDPATCGACLGAQPAFAGVDIVAWREAHRPLVERASF